MMSNPPSSLQQRQRLHRRQNSTPVAFEAMKVPNMAPSAQRPNTHRRGQSFDQRTPIRRQNQTGNMVSITNTGSIQPGQQILREAQQQRIARPGQQYQIEISQTPQCGLYSPSMPSGPGSPYENMTTMNALMQHSGNMQIAHSPYFMQDMNMPMSAGLVEGMGFNLDENNQHYYPHLSNIQNQMGMNMMPERRLSQPDLRVHTQIRPLTPTNQIHSAQFPLTPAATPFKQTTQMGYARSLQSSPVKRHTDETIRAPHPISMQRGRSLQGIVESEESHHVVPSPPSTAPIFQASTFEVAEMPIPQFYSSQAEPTNSSSTHSRQISSHPSPAQVGSPYHQSFEAAKTEPLPFFDETGGEVPSLEDNPVPVLPSSTTSGPPSPNRLALSPRRMSISDLNLEPGVNASIEETNVSLDDIAQFIDGPDPSDNKWICKFEDCDKRFGRKENIKSHVQTHLGDRQFRCDHCKKCFVRGHDLKRHAKIHTGTKPYPCLCGNAFARHDALTRHRQRGMCIGAFEGVVKKVIKRGRPRKHRPEMDERLEKASRTRQRANEHDHYASSDSSGSMSSWGSPPTENMESLSIRGNSPFDDIALFGVPQSQMSTHMNMETIALPPNMFSWTPPASPNYSCGNQPSPSHRSVTPTDLADMHDLPSNSMSFVASQMAIQHSQHSLPSLSHSSSSPAADVAAFDFAEDPMSTVQRIGMKMESDRNDFDSFLDYGNMDMGMDPAGADNFFGI